MSGSGGSVLKNTVANFGGFLVAVVVTLVLTPVIISNLGDARYGIWALFGQLVGYYGLLDMGMRGALSHYIARHSANNEEAEERNSIATAFWILVAAGIAALIIALIIAWALPSLFDLGTANVREAQLAIVIMSITISISLPTAVFHSVLIGNQRFDLVNIVEIAIRIVSSIAIYVVISGGGGLVELSLIQAITSIATWLVMSIVAKRISSKISLRPAWFSKLAMHRLFGFGLKNSVLNMSSKVIEQMDLIVVAAILGVQWVTFYRIGEALISYARDACRSLTQSFTPRLTELHAKGDMEEFGALYFQGTRLVGLFVSGLFANLVVFGESFITLWLGPDYVSGDWLWTSIGVMVILAFAHFAKSLQSISWQLLFAARKQGFLIYLMVVEAVINIALSIYLAKKIGLAGVALGTLIPTIFSNFLIVPWYVTTTFNLSKLDYIKHGLAKPILFVILVGSSLWWITHDRQPTTWLEFLLQTAIAGAVTVLLAFAFGLKPYEREFVFRRFRRAPEGSS